MIVSRFPFKTALVSLVALALLAGCGKNKGKVHFGNLSDGAEVQSPFKVEMRAENLVVEPAANGVRDGHGHFHILVNTPVPRSMDPIPNDPQHIHYGQGETETMLDLPEGEHTLILQFAKGDHRPFDPQITQEIRVRVTGRDPSAAEGGTGMGGMDGHDHGDAGARGDSAPSGDSRNIQTAPMGSGTGGGTGGSSGMSGSSGGAAQ